MSMQHSVLDVHELRSHVSTIGPRRPPTALLFLRNAACLRAFTFSDIFLIYFFYILCLSNTYVDFFTQ